MIDQTLQELVRELEQNFISGFETTISRYVQFDLYENINKIDAYLNSKHISGETDSKDREKPFFNIVTGAVNIWYRATDIDTKNISIRATKLKNKITAFLATILLGDWMRKTNFGVFLNDWGRTLARYGSAVSKHIEKDGELYSEVIPWNRLIVDAVDFENNPVIEKLWFTPSQLRKNENYDQDYVKQLIEKAGSSRETADGQKKDNLDNYIPVYEVHGELSLSYLTDMEDDEDDFEQQMHVISFVESKEDGKPKKDKEGKQMYEDFTLYRGKETQNPYQIDHLIKEDGRSMAIGAVENLFEAQWMVNHSAKAIKDQLDIASKLIYQTSDGNFVGRNALSSIDNGDILVYAKNEPLTQVNNNSHDITSLQAFQGQWQALGREINGISDAMATGEVKSGSAWRQTKALLQESHSLFELMTENKGLAIINMMRKYHIPHFKKKMDTTDEISAILTEQQIKQIDKMFVPNEVIRQINQKKVNTILSGELYEPEQELLDTVNVQQGVENELSNQGNQRFISPSDIKTKTWKKVLKDLEWELDMDVTGESKDTQGVLETLGTLLNILASKQGQPFTEQESVVINKILSLTGAINPMELPPSTPPQPTQAPQAVQQPIQQQIPQQG